MSQSRLTKLSPATLARMVNKSATENRALKGLLDHYRSKAFDNRSSRKTPAAVYEVVCDLCHVSTADENESSDPVEIDFLGYLFDDYGPKEGTQDEHSPETRTVRMSASQALHLGIALLQAAQVHGYDLRDFDVTQLNASQEERE